jgi:hypothetical protein
VSSASNANGTINVVVGSNTVPLSDVTSVTYPTTSSSSTGSTGS